VKNEVRQKIDAPAEKVWIPHRLPAGEAVNIRDCAAAPLQRLARDQRRTG
jgi:hypothetical protein